MLAREKKMALCETCGSFFIANDALERTQSHVTGKQHIGYGLVRDFLFEYKEANEKARVEEKEIEVKHRTGSTDRDKNRYSDRSSRDQNRGSRDSGRTSDRRAHNNSYRNGGGGDRRGDRYRDRSRSHSPRHGGRRRSSRSPY